MAVTVLEAGDDCVTTNPFLRIGQIGCVVKLNVVRSEVDKRVRSVCIPGLVRLVNQFFGRVRGWHRRGMARSR